MVSAGLVIGFIVCAGLAALMVGPSDRNFAPLLLGSWIVVAVVVLATQKWKRRVRQGSNSGRCILIVAGTGLVLGHLRSVRKALIWE